MGIQQLDVYDIQCDICKGWGKDRAKLSGEYKTERIFVPMGEDIVMFLRGMGWVYDDINEFWRCPHCKEE